MNKLISLGFSDGVHDQNHGTTTELEENLGKYYIEGYKKGFEMAKTKKWYIISDKGRYFPDWTESPTISFQTQEEANKRYSALTLGRGNYKVVWR